MHKTFLCAHTHRNHPSQIQHAKCVRRTFFNHCCVSSADAQKQSTCKGQGMDSLLAQRSMIRTKQSMYISERLIGFLQNWQQKCSTKSHAAPQAYRQTPLWTYLPRHTDTHRSGRAAAQAYRQTPLWTAANLPHECTRVRCDVSGSCPSKLFARLSHAAKLVSAPQRPMTCPPHASVPKMHAKSIFAGRFRKGTGCLSQEQNDTCPL
jgi:predicted CxxxxCH...CXXCH cytochrome family protein